MCDVLKMLGADIKGIDLIQWNYLTIRSRLLYWIFFALVGVLLENERGRLTAL